MLQECQHSGGARRSWETLLAACECVLGDSGWADGSGGQWWVGCFRRQQQRRGCVTQQFIHQAGGPRWDGALRAKAKEQSPLLDRRGGCFTTFVAAEWPYRCLTPNTEWSSPVQTLPLALCVWFLFSREHGGPAASGAALASDLVCIYLALLPKAKVRFQKRAKADQQDTGSPAQFRRLCRKQELSYRTKPGSKHHYEDPRSGGG